MKREEESDIERARRRAPFRLSDLDLETIQAREARNAAIAAVARPFAQICTANVDAPNRHSMTLESRLRAIAAEFPRPELIEALAEVFRRQDEAAKP